MNQTKMLTFSQFTEARDHHEMLRHLKALAQHPKTPKHEANAAVHLYNKLRKKAPEPIAHYTHKTKPITATIHIDKDGHHVVKTSEKHDIPWAHATHKEAHQDLVNDGFEKNK